jgi:hypothetical protein
MKAIVAFIGILSLVLIASPAAAQPLGRAAQQCTAPGCELATAVVLQARATGRAVLTAEAPPTSTPAPTATPWPSSTPLPTWTPAPTATPWPTDTAEPTQAPAATMTATIEPTATPDISTEMPISRTSVGDDLLVIAGGALILIVLGLITLRYFKPREWIERIDRDKGRWDR